MRHDDSIDLKINGNEQVEKVKVERGKWGKAGRRKCKLNWVSPESAIDGQNRYIFTVYTGYTYIMWRQLN